MPVKKSSSHLEALLLLHIKLVKLPIPEREYLFHPSRKFRFDFAWPDEKIAVEVEGGVYGRGRHVRPKGYSDDCVKYNEAILLGWRVLRFTTPHIQGGDAIKTIQAIFDNKEPFDVQEEQKIPHEDHETSHGEELIIPRGTKRKGSKIPRATVRPRSRGNTRKPKGTSTRTRR